MGEALRKAGYARECRRVNGNPVICVCRLQDFSRAATIAFCYYQSLCYTPFSFLSYSLYYITTNKDNTVKEKDCKRYSSYYTAYYHLSTLLREE